ncbi:MAG TPA: hypothetical protein VH661_00325 [Candidatus Dormibacteraeota bacterium]|jgi:hypothetical protein|nr:hypothetical protein [Candidatus Dormibacteraeota bacterium]
MSTIVYVAIVIVVVLAILIGVALASRRRSSQLRGRFGSEYERTLQTSGSKRDAEKELAGRVDRRKELNIVPLSEATRQQYLSEWQQVQAHFVDAPVQSVQQADTLVARVMNERGYPVAEFDQRAADISVDHPAVVENYRGAHEVYMKSAQGSANTEDLRNAMTQYRALFEELLGAGAADSRRPLSRQPEAVGADRDSAGPTAPPPAPAQTVGTDTRGPGGDR